MIKLQDADATFKGVGFSKAAGKWLIPMGIQPQDTGVVVNGTMESYELEFDFDTKYRLGVGLVAGWRLNKKTLKREKDLILPTPDLEPVLFGYRIKDLEDFSVKVRLGKSMIVSSKA